MARSDGRQPTDLRPISFETGFIAHHPGSVLVSFGGTRVLCAATVEDRVPPFRLESGGGWMTATYSMLPASTHTRRRREIGHQDGRSVEIQRLIGRVLRNAFNLDKMGPITINLDCDVLQADGGTRTASITGGWVACRILLEKLARAGKHSFGPGDVDKILPGQVAAVSLGILKGEVLTDLNYAEDSRVDTDLNLVGRADGTFVEVQGTAEGAPMRREELNQLLDQGMAAIAQLCELQTAAVKAA
jgi:ribonuclease PH